MARRKKTGHISWVERHSGLMTSALLFAALFFILAAKAYRHEVLPVLSQPVRVSLQPAAQAAPAEPTTPPPLPDTAATKQQQEEPAEEPQEPLPQTAAVAMESAPLPPEPIFLIAEDAPEAGEEEQAEPDLEASRERARQMTQALETEQSDIKSFLMKEQLAIRGQDFDFSSQGLAEGAVRTFDITHVPEASADYVFKKYGIRIVKQRLSGSETGGFLNAAKTRQGVYTNRPGQGLFEVFQITARAQAKMGQLEMQAIEERGLDPATTQVQEVVFSVGQVGGDWDLVIRTFKARDIN